MFFGRGLWRGGHGDCWEGGCGVDGGWLRGDFRGADEDILGDMRRLVGDVV